MSAPGNGYAELQEVKKLMKEMGSPNGFSPVPPAQHQWQQAGTEPLLHRMWSELVDHTCFYGHRSPFAITKTGATLTMKMLAALLGVDVPNCYRTWREGCRRGLWRNGTKAQGRERLYLLGKITPNEADDPIADGEENAKTTDDYLVRTRQWSQHKAFIFNRLPQHIRVVVDAWPTERLEAFLDDEIADELLEKATLADLVAAGRAVINQRKDTRYRLLGLEPRRQKHTPKDATAEDLAEIAEREARLAKVVAPFVEKYVQEILPFVQSSENACTTSSDAVCTAPSGEADLIPNSLHSSEGQASSLSSDASHSHPARSDLDGEKPVNQRDAAQTPESAGTTAPGRKTNGQAAANERDAKEYAEWAEFDLDAARRIVTEARKLDPTVTLRELRFLHHMKYKACRSEIEKGRYTIASLMISSLPKSVLGGMRSAAHARAVKELTGELAYALQMAGDPEFNAGATPDEIRRYAGEAEHLYAELRQLDRKEAEPYAERFGGRARGAGGDE